MEFEMIKEYAIFIAMIVVMILDFLIEKSVLKANSFISFIIDFLKSIVKSDNK